MLSRQRINEASELLKSMLNMSEKNGEFPIEGKDKTSTVSVGLSTQEKECAQIVVEMLDDLLEY